jgi:putative oxygen-independent coproporphyrinogen III oxidase
MSADTAVPQAGEGKEAFGVYVHWPFCLSKCPYCDFNSHVRHAPIDEERFSRAFAREIETTAARAPGREVSSIFLGGGTPSLMKPQTVGAILDAIGKHWRVAVDVEVTLEANPTSVEATRFKGYRAAGVNRVSLGVQALDDASLKALGRLHTAREALDAVAIARTAFDRYSFDLIYARPDQTPKMWADELNLAIAEAAEHLSLYQLTIEPETPFFGLHAAGKLKTPDEATARALYDVTQDVCSRHRLPAYEISNHARPGAECRHNLVYWRGEEYAGIGPGAHGRLDIDGVRHAVATEKHPEAWLMRVEASGHGVVTDDRLNSEERADEFLLMGLRLAEGIDPARYAALSGRALDPRRIALLREQGAISVDTSGRLRVTQAGFPLLDAVVADLAATSRPCERRDPYAAASHMEKNGRRFSLSKPPVVMGPRFREDDIGEATRQNSSASRQRPGHRRSRPS